MLPLRPKLATETSKEWICCFCVHVRTGTVLLGIWHVMLQLIALAFLAAIVRDPRLTVELERESFPTSSIETRPTPFSQQGPNQRNTSLFYHDVDAGAVVTVCTLSLTILLIYGAARGKSTFLLPFFCMQIFDFAITVLTVTGYLCYLQSIRRLVVEATRVPWRDQLLALPVSALVVVILGLFAAAIMLKAYFITVVWRCYKYLTMRTHAMHTITPYVISSSRSRVLPGPPPISGASAMPSYSSLLPDYEEAVKQTPPPSYRAATLMTSDPADAANPTQAPKEQNQPAVSDTVVMLPPQGEQVRV